LVYYCGFWEDDEGKTHSFSSTIEPFAPIAANRALLLADSRFHTEALHDLLETSSGPAYGYASVSISASHNPTIQLYCLG
jgi:peptide subunit release factor 1 (eRF1)